MRVDIGATSAEEVFAAGIDAGDRVTFDTPFQTLPHNRVMGKAFDDRLGCYLLIALLRELHQTPLDCELWLVASSSEEVGLRGGQTATRAIHPDIALVLDTACWSKNFDYGSANHRQIGAGPMLVLYDKTLIAPAKLIALAETIARSQGSRCKRHVQQRRNGRRGDPSLRHWRADSCLGPPTDTGTARHPLPTKKTFITPNNCLSRLWQA